jgi:hypothetical protein
MFDALQLGGRRQSLKRRLDIDIDIDIDTSLHFDARTLYKIHRVTPRVDDVLDDKEATVVVVVVFDDDEDDDADECCRRRNIVIINCENNPGNHDVRMELRIDGVR